LWRKEVVSKEWAQQQGKHRKRLAFAQRRGRRAVAVLTLAKRDGEGAPPNRAKEAGAAGCWMTWEAFKKVKLKEWRRNPELQRTWAAKAVECNKEHPRIADASHSGSRPPLQPEQTYLQMGDSHHVIRPDVIAEICNKYVKALPASHPNFSRVSGPMSAGRAIIKDDHKHSADKFMFTDSKKPGKLEPLGQDKPCSELHPGLCRSTHSWVYRPALIICQNLNTLFFGVDRWQCIGRCVRLAALMADGSERTASFMICHARSARPAVQILSSLARADNGDLQIPGRPGEGLLGLNTSYGHVAAFCGQIHGDGKGQAEWGSPNCPVSQVTVQEFYVTPQPSIANNLINLTPADAPQIGLLPVIGPSGAVIFPNILPRARRKRDLKKEMEERKANAGSKPDPIDAALTKAVIEQKKYEASFRKHFCRLQFLTASSGKTKAASGSRGGRGRAGGKDCTSKGTGSDNARLGGKARKGGRRKRGAPASAKKGPSGFDDAGSICGESADDSEESKDVDELAPMAWEDDNWDRAADFGQHGQEDGSHLVGDQSASGPPAADDQVLPCATKRRRQLNDVRETSLEPRSSAPGAVAASSSSIPNPAAAVTSASSTLPDAAASSTSRGSSTDKCNAAVGILGAEVDFKRKAGCKICHKDVVPGVCIRLRYVFATKKFWGYIHSRCCVKLEDQHLASALASLQELRRTTVLSEAHAEEAHDVVQQLLMGRGPL